MSWKAEVTWLLPGATLAQVRDLAAVRSPLRIGYRQLVATVTEDDRLEAHIYTPRSNRQTPVLKGRLLPDDRGVLIQGQVTRTDLDRLTGWLIFLAVMVGVVLAGGTDNLVVTLLGLVFVGGFAAVTPSLWRQVSRQHRDAVQSLENALLTRFAVDD